jgi:DNA-binding IclR family transcriptional regulator
VHSTSLGKAMMAFLPEIDADPIHAGALSAMTINTLTDARTFRRQVDEVRRRGYAIEIGENEDGLMCIGVPILDPKGYPVAAMSLSAPERRMKPGTTAEAVEALKNAARRISFHLAAQIDGTALA